MHTQTQKMEAIGKNKNASDFVGVSCSYNCPFWDLLTVFQFKLLFCYFGPVKHRQSSFLSRNSPVRCAYVNDTIIAIWLSLSLSPPSIICCWIGLTSALKHPNSKLSIFVRTVRLVWCAFIIMTFDSVLCLLP